MQDDTLINLTASIVSATYGHSKPTQAFSSYQTQQAYHPVAGMTNPPVIAAPDIADYIAKVHGALVSLTLAKPLVSELPLIPTPCEPAVPIKESVHPDYLICLDDGLKFKTLKNHLRILGMTPDKYRAKWSLPADYPMVAPNYARQRSEIAKKVGLGKRR